jgi:hypothetical protein
MIAALVVWQLRWASVAAPLRSVFTFLRLDSPHDNTARGYVFHMRQLISQPTQRRVLKVHLIR